MRYRAPLLVFAVLDRGIGAGEAEDRVQSFLCYLMQRPRLDRYDPGLGRFRTYLLTLFKRFLRDEHERTRAYPRRFQRKALDDVEFSLKTYRQRRSGAEEAYDREWALAVIREALTRCAVALRDGGDETAQLWLQLRYLDPVESGGRRHAPAAAAKLLGLSPRKARAIDARVRRRVRSAFEKQLRSELGDSAGDGPAVRLRIAECLEDLKQAMRE